MSKTLTMGEYRDKVQACWLGKNIGGSLGTPFEGKRGVWDITTYTTDLTSGPLPNDDLDLQLVWLNAVEKYGRCINSEILADYWLAYIVPHWSEYGTGKVNMQNGICPPFSGEYHNQNKDSCGCFIRSEIWACLAPGHPQTAIRYALEDGICDHIDEGLYAEMFVASIQSAAFVESDRFELIDIGLSYIPDDCAVARAVKTAIDCYNSGMDWKQTRVKILQDFPCSFGLAYGYVDSEPEPDIPKGRMGYDVPANMGIMVTGWLFGEGDFGKSICITAGCGEDGDCTSATLGAILGIIGGTEALPPEWTEPLGNKITTISVARTYTYHLFIPDTIEELTDRVCRMMPVFLERDCDIMNENGVTILIPENLRDCERRTGVYSTETGREWIQIRSKGITRENVLMCVTAGPTDGLHIQSETEKEINIHIENNLDIPQWAELKWIMPEDWQCVPGRNSQVFIDNRTGGSQITELTHKIIPGELRAGKYTITLEITSVGRLGRIYIPITLITGADESRCQSYDDCRNEK